MFRKRINKLMNFGYFQVIRKKISYFVSINSFMKPKVNGNWIYSTPS